MNDLNPNERIVFHALELMGAAQGWIFAMDVFTITSLSWEDFRIAIKGLEQRSLAIPRNYNNRREWYLIPGNLYLEDGEIINS